MMSVRKRRWLLCGGIGSGKSETRRILAGYGIKTIDADSVGHGLLEPSGAAFERVVARWPEVVVRGRVDRRKLGHIVFDDDAELSDLELITHPLIIGKINTDVELFEGPVVVEIPLLSKTLGEDWARVVVDAPDQARLDRAVARGLPEEEVRARMARQPSRSQWLAAADLVIPNAGSLSELEVTVRRALRSLTDD